ncbi:unnamed protein product [Acanthosepion pharaonis]|uniref:Uncharacterized protein n=1 Tax=Acanthosepion pharaonis TaxID=158019 RepID=A0A812C476_ACAPH|nr:unnamed protein product [Sepia pharaonis]
MPMTVQLESGTGVYFTTEATAQIAEQPKDARPPSLNYVPSYFRSDKEHGVWKMRKQDKYVEGRHSIKLSHCLGRVYTITPRQQECVYLRLLLHKTRETTSFADLKTVDGHTHATYLRYRYGNSGWKISHLNFSIYLSIYLSIYIYMFLNRYCKIYLAPKIQIIYLSLYLSIYLSIYLEISL